MDKHKELFDGASDEDRSVLSTYLVTKVNKALASDYYVEWLGKSYGVEPSKIAVLYSNKTGIATNILQNMLEVSGIAFNTTLVSDTTYIL